ncbi:VIT1/CCC1 transporter family protein [Pseudarthrobacter phenanthrenivorans]|jgi:VIT1/CCC1 family predicted Fe2+/Mn2+ transporter|uniref:Membrane protein n=1 Tax=Pseudarthrobacter phenanthrenivorans TaxID=361575 RepID=A0A0B4DPP9_PSEPS|nr:VIT family protein [Pseudarthrobacter phenanthrenivorans]KIC66400.1 membrane protein [Pseudarthrobacter phenanthrenivorans]
MNADEPADAEKAAAQETAARETAAAGQELSSHRETEPHSNDIAHRLNWLRAGVLGANDGIVSVAAIVVGVAGATSEAGPILAAGAAGVVGGAVSMALGEYVSVSSQRDSQRALIEKERRELAEEPEAELAELAAIYEAKGLSPETAATVARELTDHDVLAAHLSAELNIDEADIVSPWHAAFASAVAFTIGAILPMLAILLPPPGIRVPLTFTSVLVALALTGALGAWIGGGSRSKAAVRVVVGGALALAATFAIGNLLGASGVV